MSEEAPDRRQREIRLTPPPRIEPVGAKLRRRRAGAGRTEPAPEIIPPVRRGRPWWAVPLAFGLLALLAALGLFFLNAGEGFSPFRTRAGADPPRASDPPVTEPRVTSGPAPAAPEPDVGEGPAPSRSASRTPVSPAPTSSPPAVAGKLEPSRSRTGSNAASPPATTSRATRSAAAEPQTGFGRAMADGLAALDAGDWRTARDAFARAAELDPESPEPAAGLARVEAAAGRVAIEELRERASRLVAAEAWEDAAADYRAALEIDPTLTFARDGLQVAESRGALFQRLAYHLERPERLTASEVLDEVERLLDTARAVDRAGPKHAAQVAALEELAAKVRLPVRVALVSDERTEVTVHRVGRLGTFARRELELRPGTYTVVGSRAGYRDVRRELKVEPGAPPEPFEIRCEEKI